MSKRRPSGDGMIRKRKDGRWEGRIVIGHKQDRSPIFRYFSAKTQRDLMEKLVQNKQEFEGVDLREDCMMPLGSWLDQWLEEYAAPTIRPTTLKSYRSALEQYVKPHLGDKPLLKLCPEDIRQLYEEVLEHGRVKEHPVMGHRLSPATIHSLHGVLHQALDAAVQAQLIPNNPSEAVTLPKAEARAQKILNGEQLDRFLETIQQDELWYDFFYTEITTGLRLGEICGLQWRDFDSKEKTLSIRRTVHLEAGGGVSTGETKTSQGRRTLTLPPSTLALLQKRRKLCVSKLWIFPDLLQPEQPTSPQRAYRRLKEFLEEAELPNIRFHDLRHTFATHALSSGVDPKTLSGLLGHSKASFTLDTYTHVTGEMQRKAADIVGGFLADVMV